ncbi:Ppx/GppA family phosphatase [Erythrobacter sp. LQ02-29]|uniref:Ppx/GppA phosphatase family protein n=1 Tax=Erythrobacter sp. LQ02-29 TaxID=2920384 RepID=UPI001F4E0348|nr:Ppx/GppA family phosphatase [Erythrobacter sp. LQ02-29]
MRLGRRDDREGLFSGNKPHRAIIDIGSNTVRLVVYGGAPRAPGILLNEKVQARLGRDIGRDGKLAKDAMHLALDGLARYRLLLHDLGIERIDVVATAAVRDASNGPAFLKKVRALGFAPRLLSGEDEAIASAFGVIGAFPRAHGLVADLGGGSLELVPVSAEAPGDAESLPMGTLRLPELGGGDRGTLKGTLKKALRRSQAAMPDNGNLYLVGGTWRAMAVYAMERAGTVLTDPHGLTLTGEEALSLTRKLARSAPARLHEMPRISTMRSQMLPDAAVLLQVLVKRFQPRRLIVSAWGLREGLLYSQLEPHVQARDPLISGVSNFAIQRGAPPALATRVAGWTVEAAPPLRKGDERLRMAATMLSLAAMQIEPNLRIAQGIEWALQKRWLAIDDEGRAMLAAAICGNGNALDLPAELKRLAPAEALEEALCWGLATRLCRRLGARSMRSLEASRLSVEDGKLVLRLERDRAALYATPTEKDLNLLAGRLDLKPAMEVVDRLPD